MNMWMVDLTLSRPGYGAPRNSLQKENLMKMLHFQDVSQVLMLMLMLIMMMMLIPMLITRSTRYMTYILGSQSH